MSAITSALSGVMTASARFDKAASSTVRDVSQGNDIVSDLVEQIDSRNAFQASINVVKTANDMLGRLLDIKT